MMFEKATSSKGAKKDDWSSTRSRKSSASKKNSQLNIVESNGSIFFSKAMLKYMVDQQFEYQHGGSTQIGEQSIFRNMEILMKERGSLPDDFMKQSDFFEKIRFAIRG